MPSGGSKRCRMQGWLHDWTVLASGMKRRQAPHHVARWIGRDAGGWARENIRSGTVEAVTVVPLTASAPDHLVALGAGMLSSFVPASGGEGANGTGTEALSSGGWGCRWPMGWTASWMSWR
jgi:hypothetical protein